MKVGGGYCCKWKLSEVGGEAGWTNTRVHDTAVRRLASEACIHTYVFKWKVDTVLLAWSWGHSWDKNREARKMRLRAHPAHSEDHGLVSAIHVYWLPCNYSSKGSDVIFRPLRETLTRTYTYFRTGLKRKKVASGTDPADTQFYNYKKDTSDNRNDLGRGL